MKDPKIDEKPPPYECSSCGASTWSWTEAKHHICQPAKKQSAKTIVTESKIPVPTESFSSLAAEDLVRTALEIRSDHPDWAEEKIVQHAMKSYWANKTHN